MAILKPFKAVRPTRDKANLVVSRSYHIYSKEGLEFRLKNNPYSFLQILNPGYKYDQEINGKKEFNLVRNRYLEFKDEGFFTQDNTPNFYLYKMITREHTFIGIVGATAVEDYEKNVIKIHENTLEKREQLFKEYIDTVGFNTEPVLLTYPRNNILDELFLDIMKERPEYEFSTTDRIAHHVWLINNEDILNTIQNEFTKIDSLYIADGHHRCASSALLAQDYKQNGQFVQGISQNYFMSFLIPEEDLKIYEFFRLVKDLNGLSKKEFLIALDEVFTIENCGLQPQNLKQLHHFNMYLDGEFYQLHLRSRYQEFNNTLDTLDAQILYNLVLQPILGITDLRNDKRIDYLPGNKTIVELKNQVDNGDFKVAFGMLPIDVNQMKRIADEGLQMPPKSTYIEPKLRSGLTIYEF
ncbi:DUF1015 domain-containing protein [Pseudofulvibacter geojedonensis]|uniref:DUF1015 domain-containing protein n=1 Tax=Pseudofulvibacter geojedonensis TaxID=1123758 RepID=A0ABW3HYY1_9FLAO